MRVLDKRGERQEYFYLLPLRHARSYQGCKAFQDERQDDKIKCLD